MTQRERQGWLIVASLWVTLFIIFGGGFLTAGVFFTPLLRQFGWGRAQLSTLQGSLAISAGISAPLIGWLLDRVEARIVMVVGAVLRQGRERARMVSLATYPRAVEKVGFSNVGSRIKR
jgi:MFS family permease